MHTHHKNIYICVCVFVGMFAYISVHVRIFLCGGEILSLFIKEYKD